MNGSSLRLYLRFLNQRITGEDLACQGILFPLRRRVDPVTLFEIMGRTTKSNLPQDVPLKWNVEKGAAEFGVSNATLRKALAETSAAPD